MAEEHHHGLDPWGPLLNVPCELALELQVPGVKVVDLLNLSAGTVLSTHWKTNQDLPLLVNGKLLGWVEFESAGENMSVRLTEFSWEQTV